MNRRRNALGMTMASLVVLFAAAGEGQGPAPFASAGKVEMTGEWDDPTNFSGAVMLGGMLLIGSDEVGYLQVGRDKEGKGAKFEKSHDIELTPKQGGEDVEVDVEALAADNKNTVYALGSHSRTRRRIDRPKDAAASYKANIKRFSEPNDPAAAPERDKLFRFTFDPATGKATAAPKEISLRAIIDGQGILKPFLASASKENGVDLEGLAVDGATLFAGFRGPLLRHGFAPVLKFTFDAPKDAALVFVPLDGRGIRDLAKVPDGILVLAGPVGDSDQSHRLYRWNGQDCIPGTDGPGGKLEYLGEVPTESGGKAEAIAVNSTEGDAYIVTFFYDSLQNGGPQRFRVPKAGHSTGSTQLCGMSKPSK